ncbi:SpoIIE family protein phosphatase [Thermopirellula anaerolimosa]
MAQLRLIQGAAQEAVYPLVKDCTILGRHPNCDIVLEVGAVSRQHARIIRNESGYYLEDLNSRNGTYLNDQRVIGRQPLRDGDHIRMCDLLFEFSDPATGEALDEEGATRAAWVDDEAVLRSASTVMSKLDVSSGAAGVRLRVNPEAKLRALLEISQNLGQAVSPDEVLARILKSLFNVFLQADRGFVVLKDPRTGRLMPRVVHSRRPNAGEVRMSKTIIQAVMESKQAILSADAATDSRFDLSQSIADFPIHSMMCAPLITSDGTVLGAIQIDTSDRKLRFTPEDLEVLAAAAGQAAVALENALLHEASLREEVLRRELSLAHKVQQGFLPSSPPEVPGYYFFDLYDPAHEVGGDYFDYITLPANRLAVALGDVSGKGIAAALLMAKLSAEIRYCLASETSPTEAMAKLNRAFCVSRWEDRFITLLLAVLDPVAHRVTFVNAGHCPGFLRRADGSVTVVGEKIAGPPLGIDVATKYAAETVAVQEGDLLLLYTDGLPDAMNVREEFFGQDRILEVLAKAPPCAEEAGKMLMAAVQQFTGHHEQMDDICMVLMNRKTALSR